MMEVMITSLYWLLLYKHEPYCNAERGWNDIRCVNEIGDHIFPLLFLRVDFLVINCQPILPRHILPITLVSMIYLGVNFVGSKV